MALTRRQFLLDSGLVAATAALPAFAGTASAPARAPANAGDGSWDWVRAQFNLNPNYLHFASFYIVSHPRPVREAIEHYRKAIDDDPLRYVEHAMFAGPESNLQLRVCEAAARYVNGKPEEIALVPNTTTGLALVYQGLAFKPGEEILVTTHDHYSHHESVRLAAQRCGASWRRVPLYEDSANTSVDEIVTRARAAVRANTRALGVTWVHSSTGVRLPVRAIADALAEVNREREPDKRVLLIVDGVHGFGAVDENVADMGADFFVAGTHKWLFAPRGTGIVWARPENWARMQPTVPTFSSFESYMAWLENRAPQGPTQANQVTPGGFLAYEHQWAMTEAFRFQEQIGRARLAKRIAELNTRIKEGLADMRHVTVATPRDPSLSAGIVSFRVKDVGVQDAVARLHARNVLASTSPYANPHVRLAAGIMNNEAEVDRALEEVARLA